MSHADPLSSELERIVLRYARMVRAVGRRRGLGDAELDDLIQDVRIRLWRALEGGEKLRTVQTSYVYRAAMSAALDMIRRRRARPEDPLEHDQADAVAMPERQQPDARLDEADMGARLDQAVNELDPPRDVIVRLYLTGYGRMEIADLLGWTEPKVRNLLYRGLADLRTNLLAVGIGWRAAT